MAGSARYDQLDHLKSLKRKATCVRHSCIYYPATGCNERTSCNHLGRVIKNKFPSCPLRSWTEIANCVCTIAENVPLGTARHQSSSTTKTLVLCKDTAAGTVVCGAARCQCTTLINEFPMHFGMHCYILLLKFYQICIHVKRKNPAMVLYF